jgi:alanine racemase
MEPVRHGSYLEVDLGLLKSNVELLKSLYNKNEILFMVKADAYGHGLISIVDYAFKECGIREFGVATLNEALYLRDQLPEFTGEVYVFSELGLSFQDHKELYLQKRIIPVIARWPDLKAFLADPKIKSQLPLCLKFNTGMNRLGLPFEEVSQVTKILKENGVRSVFHVMTHFANGSLSMKKNNRNQWQIERFQNIKDEFKSSEINIQYTSLANSGALEQGVGGDETHIRPGLMLYGPSSLAPNIREKSLWQGKVISSLKTYILHSFPVKKGDPLSYGSTPAPEDGVAAILAIGYGDGVSTPYQGTLLNYEGIQGKVCGRVCMDMTTVLFPVGTQLKQGDEFVIWSHEPQDIESISRQTNVLTYELVIQLTPRVSRIYKLS